LPSFPVVGKLGTTEALVTSGNLLHLHFRLPHYSQARFRAMKGRASFGHEGLALNLRAAADL